jgi:hypothetical protein
MLSLDTRLVGDVSIELIESWEAFLILARHFKFGSGITD